MSEFPSGVWIPKICWAKNLKNVAAMIYVTIWWDPLKVDRVLTYNTPQFIVHQHSLISWNLSVSIYCRYSCIQNWSQKNFLLYSLTKIWLYIYLCGSLDAALKLYTPCAVFWATLQIFLNYPVSTANGGCVPFLTTTLNFTVLTLLLLVNKYL
jgi:hypothetical protein